MRCKGWTLLLSFLGFFLSMSAQDEGVVFSSSGGFYPQSFSLSLECFYSNHTIRYTTNGNRPTSLSPRYEEPLWLDEQLFSTAEIYKIPISPPNLMFVPDSVSHAIIIRAAVFDESDKQISEVYTNTYIIENLCGRNNGLAVLSICADSLALFDYETGIFVPGVHWDASHPEETGNYLQKGREWERLANVEFYDSEDNSGINQECGLRTQGNRARVFPNKGMKIYAREEYGAKRFRYKFFADSPLSDFKRLIVKPYSTLFPYAGIQDNICNRLALCLNMEAAHSRPVRVYLNGEYWGIYFLQEKLDEHYLEDHFDVDEYQCNIVKNWEEVEHGSAEGFVHLLNWLETADLSLEANYEHLTNFVDIESFMDYVIFETFIANKDWPANNTQCWQEVGGKWRWMFYDGDYTLTDNDFDVFGNLTYTGASSWPASRRSTLMFRRLIRNDIFRARFEERVNELCGNELSYESMAPYLREVRDAIRPEIQAQSERFGMVPSVDYWNWGVYLVDEFLKHRAADYLRQVDDFLENLPEEHVAYPRFVIYPNPTDGEFNLNLYDNALTDSDLVITDVNGRVVWRKRLGGDTLGYYHFDVDLPSGLYLVRLGNCQAQKLQIR